MRHVKTKEKSAVIPLAGKYFDNNIAPVYKGFPEEHIEKQRESYIKDVLNNPEAMKQLLREEDNGKLQYNPRDPNYVEPSIIKTPGGGYGGNAWVGSKVANGHKYMPSAEITKNIRQDIKKAVEAGYLPKGLSYSVKKDEYSMGFSVNINIS